MCDSNGIPLYNRAGRRLFILLAPLTYHSDVAGATVTANTGFISDLGTVPRIPLIYDDLGEIAQEGYVIHDRLYEKKDYPRAMADKVLLEALAVSGIEWRKRETIYMAVRCFGGSHW